MSKALNCSELGIVRFYWIFSRLKHRAGSWVGSFCIMLEIWAGRCSVTIRKSVYVF